MSDDPRVPPPPDPDPYLDKFVDLWANAMIGLCASAAGMAFQTIYAAECAARRWPFGPPDPPCTGGSLLPQHPHGAPSRR